MGTEAVIYGLASLAGIGAGAYQGHRQREILSDERDRNKTEEERLKRERENNEKIALDQKGFADQREQQRRKQLQAGGYQSTIKSSPVGLVGGGMKYDKPTLIGGTY